MFELADASPLDGETPSWESEGLAIRQVPAVSQLRIQLMRSGHGVTTPPGSHRLPVLPGTTIGGPEPTILWRAPGDWLAYATSLSADDLAAWVCPLLGTAPMLMTDLSSASVLLQIEGPRALDVLMQDCSLDLEGDAVPPTHCVRTAFAQTTIQLHRTASPQIWRLFVERPLAHHVWSWLIHIANPRRSARSRNA